MATEAKWREQAAACPYCGQQVGEWRDGKTYLTGASIRLFSPAILGCWHPGCNSFFRLSPRPMLTCLILPKADFAFTVDEEEKMALDLP